MPSLPAIRPCIRWILFFSFWALLPKVALAHITSSMPDPIAKVEYQMMLEFEPDDYTTRYKLGMVLLRLKKVQQAETELRRVLEEKPGFFHALEGLGTLRIKQGNFLEAVDLLEKAAKKKESESGTYYHLGIARLNLNNVNGAKEAFTKGLAMCHSEPEDKRAFPVEQFERALKNLPAIPHQ